MLTNKMNAHQLNLKKNLENSLKIFQQKKAVFPEFFWNFHTPMKFFSIFSWYSKARIRQKFDQLEVSWREKMATTYQKWNLLKNKKFSQTFCDL